MSQQGPREAAEDLEICTSNLRRPHSTPVHQSPICIHHKGQWKGRLGQTQCTWQRFEKFVLKAWLDSFSNFEVRIIMWLLGCLASSCSQDLRSMLRKILWTRNTLSRGNPPSGTWEIAIAHGRISILTKALFNMKRTLFVTWDSQLLGITFLSTTETPHQPTTGTATPLCCVYLSSNYLCLLWVHWVHCQMQKKKHGHKVNQSLLRTGRSFMRDMLASLWYKKKSFIHGSLQVASILNP